MTNKVSPITCYESCSTRFRGGQLLFELNVWIQSDVGVYFLETNKVITRIFSQLFHVMLC